MGRARIGRLVRPTALSAALHGAAVLAFFLLSRAVPPAEAPPAMAVELAFLPAPAAVEPAAAAPDAVPPPPPAEPSLAEAPPVAATPPKLPVPKLPVPVLPPEPQPIRAEAPPPRPAAPRASAKRPVAHPPAAPVAPQMVSSEAAPAVARAGAAGAAAAGPAGPSAAWMHALDAWIDAHLDYPEESRRRGEQGAVLVRVTVARDGRVLAFALVHGSGYDELDDAARTMFRGARLPAAPLDTDPPEATLSKPVRYVLH